MELIGLWSRRILTKHNVEAGSMYSTIKTAREEGYGIMVLNPNAHFWVDGHSTVYIPVGKTYEDVPSLSSPEEHVDYVLRNLVQSFASREIYFIAHKYGAEALIQALHAQFDVFKDRVAGIAITEGTQSIDSFSDPAFKNWWNMNTVGYISSSEENKDEVEYMDHAGCNCVKTGTKEYDFTTIEAMPAIFRFFNTRKGRDNTFDSYKDVVRPQIADDPTTAIKTIHVGMDDEDDDIEWDTDVAVEE
ncbi:hypothetical protein BGZ51_002530 [Haplosporangium sp. Z 767]|nr:hypothetical protein BGZ51_002530 [Haplosporangium sp. Z 767]KAF9186408.1 hypothetical protein BGZ50_002454 [Haplosporangium sp. Z 11]